MKSRHIAWLALLAICLWVTLCAARLVAQSVGSTPQFMPGRIVLKVNEAYRAQCTHTAISIPELQPLLERLGARVSSKFPGSALPATSGKANALPQPQLPDLSLIYNIDYTAPLSPLQAVALFKNQPAIAWVEPQEVLRVLHTPNDPLAVNQWPLTRMQLPQAWDITHGDPNVVIGIVDDAIHINHPDLLPNLMLNAADPVDGIDNDNNGYIDDYRGWDFAGATDLNVVPDNNPDADAQYLGHGSWVTGIAAAATDNGVGVAGIGFNCRFLAVKTSPNVSRYLPFFIPIIAGFEGVKYAADRGVQIINCSWGGTFFSLAGQEVIQYALAKGCVVVAAAGNNNTEEIFYPAGIKGVLSVACTNSDDTKADESTYGNWVSIAAPGSGGSPTTFGTGYQYLLAATSFAAPMVSGVAALVKSHLPALTGEQVTEQVRISADPIDVQNPTLAGKLGTGRVNAYRALTVQSPAIRYITATLTNASSTIPAAGQVATLNLRLKNILQATSGAVNVQLSTTSVYVTLQQATATTPALATGQQVDVSAPLRLQLAANCPSNYTLPLVLTYTSGSYTDREYLSFVVNTSYLTITTGAITTSINERGNVGFNNFPVNTQGLGFQLNGHNLLSEAGLLIGTSATSLSNNLRNNITLQGDQDFAATSAARFVQHPTIPIAAEARFTDAAAPAPLGLAVRQEVWADNRPFNNKYIILRYTLRNTTPQPLSNVYVGQCADWDVGIQTLTDSVRYLAAQYLSYATTSEDRPDKPHAAIAALTTQHGVQAFAARADDFRYDLRTNKFDALSSPDSSFVNKGDVMHLVSQGPFTLAAGDSVTVAFAMLAAGSLSELKQQASQAAVQYGYWSQPQAPLAGNNWVYPNPSAGQFYIRNESLRPGQYQLEIFDSQGIRVLSQKIDVQSSISDTPLTLASAPGIYMLRLRGLEGSTGSQLTTKILLR